MRNAFYISVAVITYAALFYARNLPLPLFLCAGIVGIFIISYACKYTVMPRKSRKPEYKNWHTGF